MRNAQKIIGILGLFIVLALVRFFETDLFYDPFIPFYKGNYQLQAPPEFDFWRVFVNIILRFLANSFISLIIIWLAFRNRDFIKLSGFLYGILGVLLLLLFGFFLLNLTQEYYFILFYIRRFLIQPLLVLVLLPAFYYQQYLKKAG